VRQLCHAKLPERQPLELPGGAFLLGDRDQLLLWEQVGSIFFS
jgi:hypothetical protein